jgi:NTE family protein
MKELCISGGGIKGYAYLGALYELELKGELDNIEIISGSSIGAFLGGMIALGYNPSELMDYLFRFDVRKIKDVDLSGLIKRKSLLIGEEFRNMLKELFKDNIDITLKEIYQKNKIKLIVAVCCVNDQQIEYISHETHPKLELYNLILMSSAIPGFLPPVEYNSKLYVDGGIIDNHPIGILSPDAIGIMGHNVESQNSEILNFIDFFSSIIQMMYKTLQKEKNKRNWIVIDCKNINVTSFNITTDKKITLFQLGRKAVQNHYKQN